MSARPSVPRLEGEELDLLISRALDGDLSPEETRDLETILANDPAARRRKEELAGIVAEARALPSPAPPFALSTRVNANVSEKSARGGSIFHRFGFYPPPGLAIGAMVVLGIVAVGVTVLSPAPKRPAATLAERTDGPVEVFFQEGARAKAKTENAPADAEKNFAKDAAKKAPAAPADALAAQVETKEEAGKRAGEKAREESAVASSAPLAEPSGAPASRFESKPSGSVSSVVAANEAALDEKADKRSSDQNERQNKLSKAEADADAPRRQAHAEAPALSAAAPQAAGGVAPMPAAPPAAAAPAAQAPAARALKPAESRSWSVAIRGEGAKRWMLRRAPESRPPAGAAPTSSFRVTLDSAGHVTAVRALDARIVAPSLLEFVRGLVFAPLGSGAGGDVGAVADGFARDREDRARDAGADAPSATKTGKALESATEIEVEISAR